MYLLLVFCTSALIFYYTITINIQNCTNTNYFYYNYYYNYYIYTITILITNLIRNYKYNTIICLFFVE